MDITSFSNEYAFLANTFNEEITVDDLTYSNAESAFWAQRIKDPKARRKLTHLSGTKAKAKAINCEPVENWESKEYATMKRILRIKFDKSKELYQKLKETGSAQLINNNTYRDEYWGVYYGKGQNLLGKILMEIRSE